LSQSTYSGNKANYLSNLVAYVQAGFAVTISGPAAAADWSTSATQSNAHAWTVLGVVYTNGVATGLRLRNPYSDRGYMYEAENPPVSRAGADPAGGLSWVGAVGVAPGPPPLPGASGPPRKGGAGLLARR